METRDKCCNENGETVTVINGGVKVIIYLYIVTETRDKCCSENSDVGNND